MNKKEYDHQKNKNDQSQDSIEYRMTVIVKPSSHTSLCRDWSSYTKQNTKIFDYNIAEGEGRSCKDVGGMAMPGLSTSLAGRMSQICWVAL